VEDSVNAATQCWQAGVLVAVIASTGCSGIRKTTSNAPPAKDQAATASSAASSAKPLQWRGRDLTSYPPQTDATKLPEIWEEVPPGSQSYEVRKGVRVVQSQLDSEATIYVLPDGKRFYVERFNGLGNSEMRFYGPFIGDPKPLIK
jgi:hypothetical protein